MAEENLTPVEAPIEETPVEETPEAPVDEAPIDEAPEEKTFTQADIDKLLGASRRESREKLASLEARLKAYEEREEKQEIASLAARLGVKESVLTKTGLKGDDLKAYAAELEEAIGSREESPREEKKAEEPKGLKLSELLEKTPASGVELKPKNPGSTESVLEALKARFAELNN